MECGTLREVAHKICRKRKRTHMDNRIRDIEGNINYKQIRNAHKEDGSLRAGFRPQTDLCSGTNNEILSKEEEIKTRWKTYFQFLLTPQKRQIQATYINRGGTEEELQEEPPDTQVIEMAIQSMYNNKTPSIDNTLLQLYKKGGGLLLYTLVD